MKQTDRIVQSEVIVFGAGGHAKELHFELAAAGSVVRSFVDDYHSDRRISGIPVNSYCQVIKYHPNLPWLIAIGNPCDRSVIAKRLLTDGAIIKSHISPEALIMPDVRIGSGVQIFSRNVLSAGVQIDDYAIINFGCIISHDVRIGAYSTVCPGVKIAGNVEIGPGAWIGVGATISNGSTSKPLRIAEGSVIGAGACVIRDVDKDQKVVGVPARPIQKLKA